MYKIIDYSINIFPFKDAIKKLKAENLVKIESLQRRNASLTENLTACDALLAELEKQNLQEENHNLKSEINDLNLKVESLEKEKLLSNALCSSEITGECGPAIVKGKGEIFKNSSKILHPKSSAFMIPSSFQFILQILW